MEAIVLPDTYWPSTNNSGDFVDSINNIDWYIKKSVYCPCCARVGQTYTRETLKKHFDTKKHKEWLADQNENKPNILKRNAELEANDKNQRCIIAKLETERCIFLDTIACLTKQNEQLTKQHNKEPEVATANLLD